MINPQQILFPTFVVRLSLSLSLSLSLTLSLSLSLSLPPPSKINKRRALPYCIKFSIYLISVGSYYLLTY